MDVLEVIGLTVDAGLCVLIWLVQLVIYPGLAYYSAEDFRAWHARYTVRITVIVFPLMVLQVVLGGLELFAEVNWVHAVAFGLIICTWLSTFIQFVPLHTRLSRGHELQSTIDTMVRRNWLRTILWSAILILSLLEMIVHTS